VTQVVIGRLKEILWSIEDGGCL